MKVTTMIANTGDALRIPVADLQAMLDNLVANGQAIAATLFITRPDGSVLPIGDTANAPLFPWHHYTPPELKSTIK